jgi:hypothetical protein
MGKLEHISMPLILVCFEASRRLGEMNGYKEHGLCIFRNVYVASFPPVVGVRVVQGARRILEAVVGGLRTRSRYLMSLARRSALSRV